MDCACTVELDFDGTIDLLDIHIAIALKKHQCHECDRMITVGAPYCREYFESEGRVIVFNTCDDCYSLRQVFFSSGWYYSMLWESFNEMVDEVDGDVSVTCIKQLTPTARGKALDMIEEYWEKYLEEENEL